MKNDEGQEPGQGQAELEAVDDVGHQRPEDVGDQGDDEEDQEDQHDDQEIALRGCCSMLILP